MDRNARLADARLRSGRRILLRRLHENGIQDATTEIRFISPTESQAIGENLWKRIRLTESVAVTSWEEARQQVHRWLSANHNVLFFHCGNEGTMQVSGSYVKENLEALRNVIGPDIYLSSLDQSS